MTPGWLAARLRRRWRVPALVAVVMVAFVLAVYSIVVLGGGALIGHTQEPSLPLSIMATVSVALLFAPVQKAAHRAVARAVHDGATDPYETLSRFAENLAAADTTDRLPARMAELLAAGTGARWAQVWLVVAGRLVLAATWPPDTAADTEPPPLDATPSDPSNQSGRRSLPVVHGGHVLAVLTLQERPNLSLTAVEQRLFSGLAGQAGPVLQGVALQVALRERHSDLLTQAHALRASRQRLIDTQDAERRRLERDMHDGAQQHLVALAVNLRVAQTVAQRSPARAATVLATQADAAVQTIATLSSLSRGISPRLLTDSGLLTALRSALATNAIPVTVRPDHLDVSRMVAPVQAALYYCALEAVQNATKHSGASQLTVTLTHHPDAWTLTVHDDGRGFDPNDTLLRASAGGLLNMEDRLGAVGASLAVNSRPGDGTSVQAHVPHETQPA